MIGQWDSADLAHHPTQPLSLVGEEMSLDPIGPPRPPAELTASKVEVLVPVMGGLWS